MMGISFSYLEFSALLVTAVAVYAGSFFDCKRRTRKKFHDLMGLLETHPEGWCLWRGYQAYEASQQFQRVFDYLKTQRFTLSDFIIHLEGESATHLESAFRDLIEKDHSFSLRIKCGHKNAIYLIKGTRLERDNTFVTWVRDITDRVHSQKILIEGSERNEKVLTSMEHILNALPFPVWHRNSDLKLDYCNQAYQDALAVSSSEIFEEGLELLPKGQGKSFANAVLTEGKAQSITAPLVVGDEFKLYNVSEIPDSACNGTCGFAIDIDDREKLQKEKEDLIRAHCEILDHLSTAVGIYDSDRRLSYYNRAYRQLNHMDEKFLKSKPRLDDILEILRERRSLPEVADFPAYKKQRIRQFHELIKPQEEMMHLPNERTLRMFAAPYPLGGLIFMFEDVTDNLSLVRKNNALLAVQRTTLDNLFEGVAVFGSDNRLTLTNSSFRRIWNLPEEQCIVGTPLPDIIEKIRSFFPTDENWSELKSRILENTTDRIAKRGQILRNDQSVIEFNYVPLPNGESFLSYTDITAAYRIEEALRLQNEALEAADRTKSEFIANVSYELRTPLNTVIGFSEILQQRYFGELNTRQDDYVTGILNSSMSLLKLINDILDLTSIEAGYMAIEPSEFKIKDLIEDVSQLLTYRYEDKKQTLKIECDAENVTWVSDEKRLKQALFNLMSNAINYTQEGGRIHIKAHVNQGELVISVSDSGIGIAKEDQKRVFRKFERGSGSQKRSSGVGLGLSLVKSIIELHGGRIELKSQVKKGTTVTCYLPQSCTVPQLKSNNA